MRSVVDGIELGCAFNLPVFPSFSALGRGEAGSYRLPALKLGKLNFCLAPPVSIGSFEKSASMLSPIVRFGLVSYWKHTKYSCGGLREEYRVSRGRGFRVVGTAVNGGRSDAGTGEEIRQKGRSASVVSLPNSLNGLSPSSFGSAAFEDSAGFAPFPFFDGPRNRSVMTTTSVTLRFCPSRSS